MATQQRRRPNRPAKVQKKEQPAKRPQQNVVYTPAEPVNRKRLILRLLTVAAVVVALFIGCSIFFKVDNIVVSGTNKYTVWAVREASGIEEGESLLAFGKAKAAGRITEALPYVKSVRIGIRLPGTVNIYIEELAVVYAAQDEAGSWWLLTSDGRIVEKTTAGKAAECTQLKGFLLTEPKVGDQAVAAEPEPEATDAEGEQVIVTVTNRERMNTALEILQQLELNEILGEAASLDVTDMANIEMWYGSRYQVKLGDAGRIDYKIAALKQTVDQMSGYQSGILDVTFTTVPDGVAYEPFG